MSKGEASMKRTSKGYVAMAAAISMSTAMIALLAAPSSQAGIVTQWRFDSTLNDSAGSNHGTLNSGSASYVTGMIGSGAISLDGTQAVRNISASGLPVSPTAAWTISVWARLPSPVVGTTSQGLFIAGFGGNGTPTEVKGEGRSFISNSPTAPRFWGHNADTVVAASFPANPTDWHLYTVTTDGITDIPGQYRPTVDIYVDGRYLVGATVGDHSFVTALNEIQVGSGLGASWQTGGAVTIDDMGVLDSQIDASGIALINGLGRTGGIGLDQLSAAQALWASGGTATIGGATWQKVDSGLSGSLGDYSGTVSGGDATITLDGSGGGLQVIPEPATFGMIGAAAIAMLLRRRFAR